MSNKKTGQLSRVIIEGFKSIKKCDLELRNLNVLIGSNGAGKSNFVSAFTMLQRVLSGDLSIYVGQSGVNSLFYNGVKTTDTIAMTFYFDLHSYSFELIPTQNNSTIFKNERFGYHGAWEHSESLSKGHKESVWEKGSGNEIIDSYVMPKLKNPQWRVYHFHDTGSGSKIKMEHNVINNKILLNDASNLAAFLYRLWVQRPAAYENILEAVRLIAPYFKDFELEPNDNNREHITLRWRQKGSEDIFSASQLSDGTLRFICLTALLLQPDELQPATIIIDEPELGLHPYAITVFAEMTKKAATKKQIILSTQSVELLNQFDVPDVIVVDRNGNGSELKRLDADELSDWLENEYTIGELWNKNILGGRLSI